MTRYRVTDSSSRKTLAAVSLIGSAFAGFLVYDRIRGKRIERELSERLALGPHGIVKGAEPEFLSASTTHAALVVHGFGDTPQSVRALAHHIHDLGWTVDLPLLPGHGRTLGEFGRAGTSDWLDFIRERVEQLIKTHSRVVLIGMSMGAALCTTVAAEYSEIDALVLLSPYLSMPDKVRRMAPLLKALGPIAPFRSSRGRLASILDPVAQSASRGMGVVSGQLISELYQVTVIASQAAPEVDAPVLYIASKQDSRVPVNAAISNWELFTTPVRRFRWMERSGHISTVDYEKETVFREVSQWIENCAGSPLD